ncbi:uncharacterized protein [Antedon mediterranea]|uniref:uncharacterized protein n=1 Tax=Antedon mediterranea TaxID=105859 RepID=UPI003AF65DA0
MSTMNIKIKDEYTRTADSKISVSFRDLKADLSRCFDGDKYLWIRFLLFDVLSIGDLTAPLSIGKDLLNALEDKGLITSTNVNLLLEISKTSGATQAKVLLTKYMRDNNVQEIGTSKTKLSRYRKRLFKTLKQVDPDALRNITSFYGLRKYNFSNVWDAVLKLEIEEELAADSDKIKKFAGCLGKKARSTLLDKGNSKKDENETESSSQECEPSEDLSMDDFRLLIADFVRWFDAGGFQSLNILKVLFIEMLGDIEELKRANGTTELLCILMGSGILSKKNLSVLYDTIKVTEQYTFESSITKKLHPFKNIREREVVSFSQHTVSIFDLGKSLSDQDIKDLDGRYNFPIRRMYIDAWSLILHFEDRGLLSEHNIAYIKNFLNKKKK